MSNSAREEPEVGKDPSQLVPPRIDTRMDIKGIPISEGLALVPGLAIAGLGVLAYLLGTNGLALVVIGLVVMAAGLALVFSASSEYSSARDKAQSGFSFARLQSNLPLSEDDNAVDPIHGTSRIFANGMAETTSGELVGLVRANGRNTDLMTASEANTLVGQLSDGIDHDINDFDFQYYSTTQEVDPSEVADRYIEQAESNHYLDEKWLPARELLYDVADWYSNYNAANWGTTQWSHYFVVKVGPGDIDTISRQDQTKSRGAKIMDGLLGRGSQSEDAKRKRMKQVLSRRLETIRADVLGSMSGASGEIVGPEEHVLLLSEYYAGVEQNFGGIDANSQRKASVWPGANEMDEDDGRPAASQRPSAVDQDGNVPLSQDQPGAVGVPTTPAGSDPGGEGDPSVESGSPTYAPSHGTNDTREVFEDEDEAEYADLMARVRDKLFGDLWPNAGRSAEQVRELEDRRERAVGERENIQEALEAGEVGQEDGQQALAEIDQEIDELNTQLGDNDSEAEVETRHGSSDPLPEGRPIEDILSTEYDAPGDGVGKVGDQLTKTFWVASTPKRPDSLFLQDLFTLTGIDIDVTTHVTARDKDYTIDYLEHELASIDAEVVEREEEGSDMSSRAASDDSGAYVDMWRTLRNQNTQPWELSMYITVRVGERRTLDFIEQGIENGAVDEDDYSFEHEKRRALKQDCDRVLGVITSTPASLVVTSPPTRQKQLFESCAPGSENVYDRVSARSRTFLTMGGTVGAIFPFGSEHINEESGVEQGRSLQNGTSIIADPFDRGGAPHQLTIAKSGSGKTYSVGKRALRWYLADPERTLILCDTMGGFEGVTEVCNGEHIVVDGSRTINPLDITKAQEEIVGADIDTFRMKIDEVTQFLSGLLRAQGTDPGDYIPVIEEILNKTYAKAGITSNPKTHGKQSPTMSDFIRTGIEMIDQGDGNNDGSSDSPFDHERISAKQSDITTELLAKLTGFKEDGKYQHLDGQTQGRIKPGEVTYLDLQQIEGSANAEKSTMLHLMLGQVYQTVKRAPKKSMFVIDEAHYLLHSPQMVNWLQRAARHWRHYDACMWFVSQSPQDFAPKSSEEGEGRDTITGQCSTIEFFRTPELDQEVGERFGLNRNQIDFVREKATPGSAKQGFSQGLISFSDVPGWIRVQVSASVIEDAILTYDKRDDGAFAPYFERTTGIESASTGASQFGDENATPEVDLNLDGEIGAGPDETATADGGQTQGKGEASETGVTEEAQRSETRTPVAATAGGGSATAPADSNYSADESVGGELVDRELDPEASIRQLDSMSAERAKDLEMRNMGKIGDLTNADPEAIADAGGTSIGEVNSYMEEIYAEEGLEYDPDNPEDPFPEMQRQDQADISHGPGVTSGGGAETGPETSDTNEDADGPGPAPDDSL